MESIFHNRQYARVNWHNYNVGLFFVTVSTFLSSIIGGLKSGVKRYANQNNFLFDWSPGFYEHIIRTPESYKNIKYYIRNNIKKWDGQKHQY